MLSALLGHVTVRSSKARACERGGWFRGDSGATPGASVKVTAAGRDATQAPSGLHPTHTPFPPPPFSHDLTRLFLSPAHSTTVLGPERVEEGSVDQLQAWAGAGAALHPYLSLIHTWMQRLQSQFILTVNHAAKYICRGKGFEKRDALVV